MLNVAASNEFKELYESKRYFYLLDRLSSTDAGVPNIEFYRAAVDNKFNRPGSAIKRLEKSLTSKHASQDARLQREAYTLLADSYVGSYLYSEAAKTYEQILAKFSASMTGGEAASFRNVLARSCRSPHVSKG